MKTVPKIIIETEEELLPAFKKIDEIALFNQEKVLRAFQNKQVAERHFAGTSGYGYGDLGRDTLGELFAEVFGAEGAIVSPLIASGTHAISAMLFGVLRPGDTLLLYTNPYDTLQNVIFGKGIGSLADFGVKAEKYENGKLKRAKAVFIGRSRGYEWRDALTVSEIDGLIAEFKAENPQIIVLLDNCYGEFTAEKEPNADLMAGSLIKNPGGGLAPTGGYIAGRKDLLKEVGGRLTAPGIGVEVGSFPYGYRPYYEGLFLAPHTTAQAMKSCMIFSRVFEKLGYKTLPKFGAELSDIICSVEFGDEEKLLAFVRSIQKVSPVDGHVVPYPWDMPGYAHKVIMAAGAFVQGSSIELSCDAPIKPPFIAYLQGGLTYEHAKLALIQCLNNYAEK